MDRNQEGSYQQAAGNSENTQKAFKLHRSESPSLFVLETLRTSALILHRVSHSEVNCESPTAL